MKMVQVSGSLLEAEDALWELDWNDSHRAE